MTTITSRTTIYYKEKPSSPTYRVPSTWAPALRDACAQAPIEARTVITPKMIGAFCIGCNTCCKCNTSPEALAACKPPSQNQQNAFTYCIKHDKCMGCGRSSHKKIYDLSRVAIPLAVSFEFHHKCCEYRQKQPHLSDAELIELVLVFFAPPSSIPPPPIFAAPSSWKAMRR